MENIKFEITEQDILEYLNQYKDDYKFCEALFISYLKKSNVTKEKLQILMKKYNNLITDKKDINLSRYSGDNISFIKKPVVHENVDLIGICHILIPTLKYYGKKQIHINHLYVNLDIISEKLLVPMEHPMKAIESTLDDYQLCGKLETDNRIINIKMGREHCRQEILVYNDYYNRDQVNRIKQIVKERVR